MKLPTEHEDLSEDEINKSVVCGMPEGVVFTDEQWELIHAKWIEGGRVCLDEDAVNQLLAKSDDRLNYVG